jgi:predicted Rossmann fold flavoprotein
VPLAFTSHVFKDLDALAGVSLPVEIHAGVAKQRYGEGRFSEDLLITHKGLSGPAVLQASSYWEEGEPIHVQWVGSAQLQEWFDQPDQRTKTVEGMLAGLLPNRLAKAFAESVALTGRRWAEVGKKDRLLLLNVLTQWSVKPAGTLGWKKAEVMLGGVDTDDLDSRSMMAKQHQGLYFIGECVDVTGHLGGHNFQWAWASAHACATSID